MAHLHTEPAPPMRACDVVLTLLPFALLVAAAVFYALTQPNADYFRTNAYAWGSAVLVIPAVYVMARRLGRRVLSQWWRLLWSFALVLLLMHNVTSLGWSHFWRPDLLAAQFGLLGALVLWGLAIAWIADVLMAWNRLDWARAEGLYAWFQGCVAALVVISFAIVLLVVGTEMVSQILGAALLIGTATALLLRWNDGEEA